MQAKFKLIRCTWLMAVWPSSLGPLFINRWSYHSSLESAVGASTYMAPQSYTSRKRPPSICASRRTSNTWKRLSSQVPLHSLSYTVPLPNLPRTMTSIHLMRRALSTQEMRTWLQTPCLNTCLSLRMRHQGILSLFSKMALIRSIWLNRIRKRC